MDPATILALIAGLTQLAEIVIPAAEKAFGSAEVPVDVQAEVKAKGLELRAKLQGLADTFDGDQWEVQADPPATTPTPPAA